MTTRKKSSLPPGPVLRKPHAMAFTGLGESQFDDYVDKGELPSPIYITDSGRAVAWVRAELEAWLQGRIAKRDAELVKKPAQGGER